MSDAELTTTSIVAGLFFGGNMEKSRIFLQEHGYIPKILGKAVSTVANTDCGTIFSGI